MNNNSSEILGVINIDMVGWDGNDDGVMLVNTREIGNSVELANRVIDVNFKYSINLNPQIVMPGYGSDNMAFWAYGISSIGIEEHYGVDWNPFYHTTYDDISHFNMSYFHRNTKLSIGVLATSAQIIQQSLTTEGITTLREYDLLKNYPNPFNSGTTINYYLPNEDNVSLKIYDLKDIRIQPRNLKTP